MESPGSPASTKSPTHSLLELMETSVQQVHKLESELAQGRAQNSALRARLKDFSAKVQSLEADLRQNREILERERNQATEKIELLHSTQRQLEAEKRLTQQLQAEITSLRSAQRELSTRLDTLLRMNLEEKSALARRTSELLEQARAEAARQLDVAAAEAQAGSRQKLKEQTESFRRHKEALLDQAKRKLALQQAEAIRERETLQKEAEAKLHALQNSLRTAERKSAEFESALTRARLDGQKTSELLQTETRKSAELARELQRLKNLYPLQDLLREKDRQLSDLRAALEHAPAEQRARVSRMISTVEIQRQEILKATEAAKLDPLRVSPMPPTL